MAMHRVCNQQILSNSASFTRYQTQLASLLMEMEHRLNVASLFQVQDVQPFQLNIIRHVIQRLSSIVETVRQERYGVT